MPDQLRLVDGGQITTRSYGTGDSGNIQINSRSIDLNSDGIQSLAPDVQYNAIFAAGIPAGSLAGNGDISIQTNSLSLRSGSVIAGKNIGITACPGAAPLGPLGWMANSSLGKGKPS